MDPIAPFFAADTLTQAARVGLALWGLTEGRLVWRNRSRRTGAKAQDNGSLWTIIVPLGLAVAIAGSGPALLGGELLPDGLRLAGFVLAMLGLALRQWSIHLLGRFFTIDVAVHQEQQIVQDGPYRFLRHPSYTGFGLILIGLGLSLGSLRCLFALLLLPLPGFLWRIQVEERALRRAFGDAYETYSRRTWRLIPGLF